MDNNNKNNKPIEINPNEKINFQLSRGNDEQTFSFNITNVAFGIILNGNSETSCQISYVIQGEHIAETSYPTLISSKTKPLTFNSVGKNKYQPTTGEFNITYTLNNSNITSVVYNFTVELIEEPLVNLTFGDKLTNSLGYGLSTFAYVINNHKMENLFAFSFYVTSGSCTIVQNIFYGNDYFSQGYPTIIDGSYNPLIFNTIKNQDNNSNSDWYITYYNEGGNCEYVVELIKEPTNELNADGTIVNLNLEKGLVGVFKYENEDLINFSIIFSSVQGSCTVNYIMTSNEFKEVGKSTDITPGSDSITFNTFWNNDIDLIGTWDITFYVTDGKCSTSTYLIQEQVTPLRVNEPYTSSMITRAVYIFSYTVIGNNNVAFLFSVTSGQCSISYGVKAPLGYEYASQPTTINSSSDPIVYNTDSASLSDNTGYWEIEYWSIDGSCDFMANIIEEETTDLDLGVIYSYELYNNVNALFNLKIEESTKQFRIFVEVLGNTCTLTVSMQSGKYMIESDTVQLAPKSPPIIIYSPSGNVNGEWTIKIIDSKGMCNYAILAQDFTDDSVLI